jgi:hypothetical protein
VPARESSPEAAGGSAASASVRKQSFADAFRAQARDRRALARAGAIALIVGTVLSFVNQGGRIVHGDVGVLTAVRLSLDYIVPFIVANLGAITTRRALGGVARADRPRDRDGAPRSGP